jgi:hypothetical protein
VLATGPAATAAPVFGDSHDNQANERTDNSDKQRKLQREIVHNASCTRSGLFKSAKNPEDRHDSTESNEEPHTTDFGFGVLGIDNDKC